MTTVLLVVLLVLTSIELFLDRIIRQQQQKLDAASRERDTLTDAYSIAHAQAAQLALIRILFDNHGTDLVPRDELWVYVNRLSVRVPDPEELDLMRA